MFVKQKKIQIIFRNCGKVSRFLIFRGVFTLENKYTNKELGNRILTSRKSLVFHFRPFEDFEALN